MARRCVYDFNVDEDECDIDVQLPSNGNADDSFASSGNADDSFVEDSDGGGSDIDIPTRIGRNRRMYHTDEESDEDDNPDRRDYDVRKEHFDPQWTSDLTRIDTPYCVEYSGPVLPDNWDATRAEPIDYLKLLFKDTMIDEIVTNTNNYVAFKRREKGREDKYWSRDTTKDEMKAFLGIAIAFGIHELPTYKDYWSSSDFLGCPGVRNCMSLRRFEKLCQYFCVSDREFEPSRGIGPVTEKGEFPNLNYDYLYKVRNVMDHVLANFSRYMAPSHAQSIDESMVAFRGRCQYKQFMPDKPIKRGIKIYCRCDARTGYLHQFEVYLGKNAKVPSSGNGVYFDVVDRLTRDIRGKNYQIYFDNLYTSIPLLVHLYNNKLYATGTIRKNSSLLEKSIQNFGEKDVGEQNLARGTYRIRQSKTLPNLTCVGWKDTKALRLASTMAQPTGVEPRCTRRVGATTTVVTIPDAAEKYNFRMGGVDLFDKLKGSYAVGRASKRVWKYLFWFLFQSCIVNAYILYTLGNARAHKKKRYKQLDFRHELITSLIGNFSNRRRARSQAVQSPARLPAAGPAVHSNEHMCAKRVRRCVAHSTFLPDGPNKKEKQTAYGCRICNLHLCKKCHFKYHS